MEVTFILNIRERNDCAKDKQSKYRVASTGQHQMVQKFVKELNDSTKQSEQPSNAERTATEQVETTAREIVHEAVQLPRRAIQHPARRESADSSANSQPEQSDQPRHAPESPRERPAAPRTQPDGDTAAEHTDTRTAGTGPTCLCSANRKIGHASAADHVGAAAAAAYHSDRAIGGKYAATAHGRCAHPARTATVTERTATSAAGAGPQRLCSATRKKRPRQRRRSRRSSRSIPQ